MPKNKLLLVFMIIVAIAINMGPRGVRSGSRVGEGWGDGFTFGGQMICGGVGTHESTRQNPIHIHIYIYKT